MQVLLPSASRRPRRWLALALLLSLGLTLPGRAQSARLFYTQGSATAALDAFKTLDLGTLAVTPLASGAAQFAQPTDVAVNPTAGVAYVADTYLGSPILRFNLNGTGRTVIVAGTPNASYQGLALDAAANKLYFTRGSADPTLDALQVVNLTTSAVTTLAAGAANFTQPTDLALNATAGLLYVTDQYLSTGGILRFTTAGASRTVVVAPTTNASYQGLALDAAANRLYFTRGSADPTLDALQVVNLTTSAVSTLAAGAANFTQPTDLALDAAGGFLYVADQYLTTGPLLRFTTAGASRTVLVAGTAGASYQGLALGAGVAPFVWTGGAASTVWGTPGNWSTNQVPGAANDAILPAGAPLYPNLTADVTVGSLTVNAGAQLLISGGTLTIGTGNFVLNGAVTQTGGLVKSAGVAPQPFGGSTATTLRDLEIGPAGVALTGAVKLTGVLTVNGPLASNGNLTLLSNAASTAMVVNNSGAVTGNSTVQRYITPALAPGQGYRHLSSPVTNTTVADLAVGSYVPFVNPTYNAIPAPALPLAQFPNIYGFDETRGGAVASFGLGYYSPGAVTDPLTPGRGYSVLMAPLTPDFVGTLGNGNVPMTNLTRTGAFLGNTEKSGWHLFGNPYPAPLNWDLVVPGAGAGQLPPGMSNSISVFQSTGGSNGVYLTRAGGLGTLPNGLVAMGQAFFGRVTGVGPVTFTFTNALRSTTYVNPPHYRAAPDPRPRLTLQLRASNAPPAEQDALVFYATPDATPGFDERFDGSRPAHNVGVPTLVSLTPDGEELAVDARPETALAAGAEVALLLDLPEPGTYELTAPELANLPADAPAELLDRLTNTHYALADEPLIRFTADRAGEVRGRFALQFGGRAGQPATPHLTVYPNPASGFAVIDSPLAAQLLDALGRVVRAAPAGAPRLDLKGLPPGAYVVRTADGRTARLVVE